MWIGVTILLASCSSSRSGADKPTPPPANSSAPAPPTPGSKTPLTRVARVYLDSHSDVHVVQVDSQDVRVTFDGRYRDPKLSPDQYTVGMLVADSVDNGVGDTVEVSSQLKLLRGGGFIQQIEADGFIRSWAFVRNGEAVAVYSSGLHFAGAYVLYDRVTGAALEYAKDPVTDASPDWVRALSP